MFIFDFVAETVLDQIIDWLYGKIIGFLNDFFVMMNNMGVELFDLPWVEAVTTFFGYFGWALFGVGLVVGAFEYAIEYQGGRGSIKDTAMNYIKGFMAVNLFTIVPVNLYSGCRKSYPANILCHYDWVCRDKGVLCKLKKGRHSADPDRSRKPLYVLRSKGIHRRLYSVVQAGHRNLHDCLFAVHHLNRRTDGV